MRGTRIRCDGALKALGIGVAALVALLVLPGLLAGEPPLPPDDVGLLPPPPTAPLPAPVAPRPAEPKPAKPKPAKRKPARPKPARPNRERRRPEEREPGGADPGAPAVAAAPSYLPPAAVEENFGFEH